MKPNLAKIMMLATVFLMDVLAGMEFDLFVPSFPELQIQFNLSAFLVETLLSYWIFSTYLKKRVHYLFCSNFFVVLFNPRHHFERRV